MLLFHYLSSVLTNLRKAAFRDARVPLGSSVPLLRVLPALTLMDGLVFLTGSLRAAGFIKDRKCMCRWADRPPPVSHTSTLSQVVGCFSTSAALLCVVFRDLQRKQINDASEIHMKPHV